MDCYRCLIQWGYLQKQAEKWIYPIPVLEAFIATKTCISNNHSAAGYVGYWTWDKDITTEYAYSWNNYPSYCFMIGKVQQQWGYKTSLTDEETLYPLPFTVLLGISAQLYRHPATSNTVHSILVNVTETSFKYYAGQYNLSCRPVPDADGWWFAFGISQLQWGYYTAAVGANYTDVTTPVSFSRCFLAASIDILLAASTTWPGTTQTVWNINASTANKLRFIWAKAPIELDGAVWFGIFIQTVGNEYHRLPHHSN